MAQGPLARNWTGTSYLPSFSVDPSVVTYAVYQQECCPNTQRLHWQFLVCFTTKRRLTAVKKLLGECHAEVARSVSDCRAYCMKDASRVTPPIEIGVFKADDSMAIAVVKTSVRDIILQNPTLWRSVRQLHSLQELMMAPRDHAPACVLLTGETGKGKSKICHLISQFLGPALTYSKDPDTKWWDHYRQEPLVVIDEYRGALAATTFLRLVNYLPLLVERKGGSAHFRSEFILLTSNLSFEDLFGGEDCKTKAALGRRINSYLVY